MRFILCGRRCRYICTNNCTWQADKASDSWPVRLQIKKRCWLSVGKHRAIPNQTPTTHTFPHSSHNCSSAHQTHHNYSLLYLGHTHTHTHTHIQIHTDLCSYLCVCVCVGFVSLVVSFQLWWVFLPPFLPTHLIILCKSCRTYSAPQNHFMHFLLQLCHLGVFKWFTLVTAIHLCPHACTHTDTYTHLHILAHKEMDRNTFHLLSNGESI